MKTRLLVVAAATLIASCANHPAAQAPADEKVYATGSNIPRRDRNVHTITPEAFQEMRNATSANTGRSPAN